MKLYFYPIFRFPFGFLLLEFPNNLCYILLRIANALKLIRALLYEFFGVHPSDLFIKCSLLVVDIILYKIAAFVFLNYINKFLHLSSSSIFKQ